MTKTQKLLSSLGLYLCLCTTAFSGVLVEPYLGFRVSGDTNQGTTDGSYNGALYGARLGYQFLGFMGGLDYSQSSYDIDYDGTTVDSKTDSSNLGIFVGYDAPLLVRAWATYFLSNKLDFSSSSTEYSGSGYALGAGFTGLPFVSLNLEYRSISFDEFENSTISGALNPSSDASEIILSVSLPLDL